MVVSNTKPQNVQTECYMERAEREVALARRLFNQDLWSEL